MSTATLYRDAIDKDVLSRSFFNGNRWAAHDFIGCLMAQGCTKFSVSCEGLEWTVSWPRSLCPQPKDLSTGRDWE